MNSRPVNSTEMRLPGGRGLLLIMLAALTIRAVCTVLFTGEIDTEGAEYARIAQNIIAGKGYEGLATQGTQLFFPPLFPFLIAGVSFITGDAEIAGRILSVLSGALLVYPVYLIARRMFGEAIGFGAAGLVAVHPYLVQLSTTVFCESTYLTLLLTALYSAMSAVDTPTWRRLAVSGGLYGLAYLIRPEAFVFMLVGIGFILLGQVFSGHGNLRAVAGRVLVMPICFFVVASPYIGWLSLQTGKLRMESKSPLNVATELRIQQGHHLEDAAFGVDKDLTVQGVWNQPNINIVGSPGLSSRELATMIANKSKRVVGNLYKSVVTSLEFGSPALFALAILGLFGGPWRRSLALDQLHLVILLALSTFATFFIYYSALRFYLLFLVFFCIWASAAATRLMLWARKSAAMLGLMARQQAFAASAVWMLAVAAVLIPSAAWTYPVLSAARGTRPVKAISAGLAAPGTALRIADVSTPFAFHARADFVWLPYCDEATALRYLEKMQVTQVVVRGDDPELRPYLKKWMEGGVPNSRLVARTISGAGEVVQVYDFRRAGPAG